MPTTLTAARAQMMLLSRRDLLASHVTERGVENLVATGALRRVRRGWYVRDHEWNELWSEGRHLLHVLAVHRDERGARPIFSHISAAALWGLPLYRVGIERAHITVPEPRRGRSAPDVLRHRGTLNEDEITEVHGIRVTSLNRTILDLARTLPFEAAVVAADAALRTIAVRGQRQDEARAARWRDEIGALAAESHARGIRTARRVIAFADGRAQLPGESVSRVHLARLGFRNIDLQVPVRGPRGENYHVDFGLEDVPAMGEFDGQFKYTDAAMRGGLSMEEVLLQEKRREDWIRGVTQRPYVRWEYAHVRTAADLGRRLAEFGVHPPG